jgi:hypothetical protein
VESAVMISKIEHLVEERWGIDKGLFAYALVLVLIAICLFIIFTLMGVKVIDISMMLGSLLGGS